MKPISDFAEKCLTQLDDLEAIIYYFELHNNFDALDELYFKLMDCVKFSFSKGA